MNFYNNDCHKANNCSFGIFTDSLQVNYNYQQKMTIVCNEEMKQIQVGFFVLLFYHHT